MATDTVESTSEYDPFGIGGATVIGSHDGDVLSYRPSVEGGFVRNESPVPLLLQFDLSFDDVRKSGTGRPDLRFKSQGYVSQRFTSTARDNVAPGLDGKGYSTRGRGVLQPGGSLQFYWLNLSSSSGHCHLSITATDDYGGLGTVTTAVRDVPDDLGGDGSVAVQQPNSMAQTISWSGPINSDDRLGLFGAADLLPDGIVYSGSTGTFTNVSNTGVGSMFFIIYATAACVWNTTGDWDWGPQGSSTQRASGVAALAVGQSFSISGPVDGVRGTSYSFAAFASTPFSGRYAAGGISG